MTIPRRIHTIWTKDVVPTQIRNNINSMRNLNRNWDHMVWVPFVMRNYVKDNYPHWLSLWDRINPKYGVIYADVFRYIIMRDVGGVYLDAKSLITHKLDKVIDLNAGAYIAGDRYGWLQWFLISEPGHPFIKQTVSNVYCRLDMYSPHRDGVGRNAVLNLSGPTPYTQAVNDVLRTPTAQQRYVLLDPLPHWLVYDTIGFAERERDPSHYSNQLEPLLWP